MNRIRQLAAIVLLAAITGACSIKKVAVNKMADALASTGTTFDGDDDPDLVGEALPFALKLMESLLAESPRHTGLLLATASGFTENTLMHSSESAPSANSPKMSRRATHCACARGGFHPARPRLWYACPRGALPGLWRRPRRRQKAALARVRKRDVPLLYWTAAAQGLAISASKDDPETIAQFPIVEALIRRAIELDEAWGQGALPEFLISVESSRNGGPTATS